MENDPCSNFTHILDSEVWDSYNTIVAKTLIFEPKPHKDKEVKNAKSIRSITMFSSLFRKMEVKDIKTRFEKCEELQALFPLLHRLKVKEEELRKETNNNVFSVAFQKSRLITSLHNEISNLIDNFNRSPGDEKNKLLDMHQLVTNIFKQVEDMKNKYWDVLTVPRSKNKKTAANVLKTTVAVGGFAAAAMAPTFSAMFVRFAAREAVIYGVDCIQNYPLLNPDVTDSQDMIQVFFETLKTIKTNLEFLIELNSESEMKSIDTLTCPITHNKIKDPVLCSLDGYMYEKEEIKNWLKKHRSSPMTRKLMSANQKIEEVLIANISLRNALDEIEQREKRLHP